MYFLLILSVFITYFIYKANQNTLQIKLNTISPTPFTTTDANTHYIRVLQLSDLHLEHISITPDKLFQKIKNQKFDIIAITGDFLDRPKSIPKLESYLQVIQKLDTTYGIYAVYGNHDYKLRKKHLIKLETTLNKYKVSILRNENKWIPIGNSNGLQLIGIDDHHSKKHEISKAYEGITDSFYRLVLTHDPNIVFQMDDYDFEYMLSGHFHGGQICWPKPYHLMKFGKLVRLNLIKGLIHYKGKIVYISEGLGQTGINIRVGSRPEITVHELQITSSNAPAFEKAI
ncbi:metallophosphoesterase [Bacillus tamaricis]|uniref:Metallophosphoesterase n=1 Tax=Evansella tamaricis TaxID=2069301 RepID=A0ABS6JLB2_9BACI|nr:metallophosphoesterase [Evansella tamaricis]